MSGWQWLFAILGTLFAGSSLVMALARTGPDEAASTLSKWADRIGVKHVPAWLRDRGADRVVFRWAGVATVVFLVAAIWGLRAYFTAPTTTVSPTVVPKLNDLQRRDELVNQRWSRLSEQILRIDKWSVCVCRG
jgi:hypothetical protein